MKQIYIHKLNGCAPVPLANYLKAIAVLRIVCQQLDEDARGWWKNDTFHLATSASRIGLLEFFLHEYEPAAILSPWNKGSSLTRNSALIKKIVGSKSTRFRQMKRGIKAAQKAIESCNDTKDKNNMLSKQYLMARDTYREWLHTSNIMTEEGNKRCSPLLGSGGNDGRLEFSCCYIMNLAKLYDLDDGSPQKGTMNCINAALFDDCSYSQVEGTMGQFKPAGGISFGLGSTTPGMINLFELIMSIEGSLAFGTAVTRRCKSNSHSSASAPFVVRSEVAGYASATNGEGKRGEQWMPLWKSAMSYNELSDIIRQGRCSLNGHDVKGTSDFAMAIGSLGIDSGIDEFQRFAYIERNGRAHYATPVGRFEVKENDKLGLIDEIKSWLNKITTVVSFTNPKAPAGLIEVSAVCNNAILQCCHNSDRPEVWKNLFVAIGRVEEQLIRSHRYTSDPRIRLMPIPVMSHKWVDMIGWDTPEVRLAVSFASQIVLNDKQSGIHGIRSHIAPLNPHGNYFDNNMEKKPSVKSNISSFEEVAMFVVGRMLLKDGKYPLTTCNYRLGARLSDIDDYLNGNVDERLLLSLLRPMCAIDWKSKDIPPMPKVEFEHGGPQFALYGLTKLCHMSYLLNEKINIRTDPSIFRCLSTGQSSRALKIINRRLKSSGIRSSVNQCITTHDNAIKTAAALVFPINPNTANRIASKLTNK